MRGTAGRAVCMAIVVAGLALPSGAQEPGPVPHGQSRPPGPALSPAEAIRTMTVPEGFPVELVASEPDIVNPVAMTFDERGRIWITESLEYPRKAAGPGRDRVKVLEDTDGDGKADKFTVFAEGLNIPSGIAVGHGGVWVANAPDILFLHDTDGDGKADKQRGRRHRLRPRRHARAAQLAHLGPRRLALRPQRRLQPQPRRAATARCIDFTCALFRIHPEDARVRALLRGHEQPLGRRLRQRRRAPSSAPASSTTSGTSPRPATTTARAGRIRRSPGRSSRSSSTSTRRRPTAASTTSTATPIPRVPRQALHGQHPRQLHQRRRARARRLDLLRASRARLPHRQRRLVHAGRAEDRPRRLPLHPRLVRPLPLLSGRQPRPRRDRPAQGPALPRPLPETRRAPSGSTWPARPTTSSSSGCTARTSTSATSPSGC